jgi:uncharacterized protein (TIGR02145 family)
MYCLKSIQKNNDYNFKLSNSMKVRKLLLAGLITALGLVSCVTDDDVPCIESGAKATVALRFFTDTANSLRAAGNIGNGADGTAAERQVHSLQVFLHSGDNFLTSAYFENPQVIETGELATDTDGFYKLPDGSYIVGGIETTSGQRTMTVIANHKEITGNPTKAQLENEVSKNVTESNVPANIETSGLAMTTSTSVTLAAGENLYGHASGTHYQNNSPDHHISSEKNLQLVRINARVALTDVNFYNNSGDNRFNDFELHEVAMFNVRAYSKLFGESLVYTHPTTPFCYGGNYPSSLDSYQKGVPSNALRTNVTGIDVKMTYEEIAPENAIFFYVFENDGDPGKTSKTGTFIVLKGKLLNNGTPFSLTDEYTDASGFTYYAIWIDDAGGNRIVRNTQYNLTVNIWGPGNPTIDAAQTSYVDARIEITQWSETEQDTDWGTPAVPATGVELNKATSLIFIGETETLTATAQPANAYREVTWSSNNTDVATVDANGTVTAIALGTATITATTVSGEHKATCEVTVIHGVEIDGIIWATRNVDAPGTFAAGTKDAGMFYQWNRKKGWNATDKEVEGWDNSAAEGTEWERENDPCPEGWRVPTADELRALRSAPSVRVAADNSDNPYFGVAGYIFGTDDAAGYNPAMHVFLPAAGSRSTAGTLANVGRAGRYWSSTQRNTTSAMNLTFDSGGSTVIAFDRAFGYSVRCVAE